VVASSGDVPTLVMDGIADRVLPFSATAERLSGLTGLISDVKLVPIKDGPHAIAWHRCEVLSLGDRMPGVRE
jgi:non-heme chloroperoxidase